MAGKLTQDRIIQLKPLCGKLDYFFKEPWLLDKALTHRSYANEAPDNSIRDNERLEFLGDSVLDLVVSRYILFRDKDLQEGALSKIRSQMVNETALANIARGLNLGEYLLLGKGEESTGGRDKNSLLANALEAVIAAIYLDSSFKETYHILLKILKEDIDQVASKRTTFDHKGVLQSYIKGENGVAANPQYRLINETGPDHEKTFTVQVWISDEPYGVGVGKTKKEAEQSAAMKTYESMVENEAGSAS